MVCVIFQLIKRKDGETYDVDAAEMARVKTKVDVDAGPDMACFGNDANVYSELEVAHDGTKADDDTESNAVVNEGAEFDTESAS